ncbi:MAG: 30S ribosomal protein S1 [Gammaproteobacteria bacterium]
MSDISSITSKFTEEAQKEFSQLLETDSAFNHMTAGTILRGEVVRVDKDYVTVNAGMKSEGVIPVSEFLNEQGELQVAVGDPVDVALVMVEDGFGETRLSREKAKRRESWTFLENAYNDGEKVTGIITGKVKGGFTVELQSNIRAFLPGSLLDVRPVKDSTEYENCELDFSIIKMDMKRNNIVVSRRANEREANPDREAFLSTLQEGQVVKGIVKNLTDYGAFIDLGGVDGLLHITDMSWKRIKHPSEMLNVGDEISVAVLKFDKDNSRVSLGLKQLGDDPWVDIKQRYPINTRLSGRVTNIADYGCFVEIEEGVEGLVHVSEMDWTNKNINPNSIVKLGIDVEVMVLDIDEDRRRISLGLKQCVENPWDVFATKHVKGDKIQGTIKSITDFGLFIGLKGGIDGLVHVSDISWSESGEQAVRQYHRGDEIDAVVLAVDAERERISLGIKQLQDDPMADFADKYKRGDAITGTITAVDDKGVTLSLPGDVIGFIRTNDLAETKVEDPAAEFTVGDSLEGKFLAIDRKSRQASLTLKAVPEESEKPKTSGKASREKQQPATATTLGDLLKEKMESKNSDES